jgi:hypothetical protein
MAELLDSSVRLDLSGRGLGRVEMGIAAQLLHNNSSLQVLKLSDNPIGQFGMETLADAVAHARPPLTEAHLGNLGIRSGQQVQRFLRALRHYRAPLRVLDLHGNCLLPPLGDEIADPQLWLQSTPETDDFNEWCDTTLAALAEGHKVVLVEKPFGVDEAECRAVMAAAEAVGAVAGSLAPLPRPEGVPVGKWRARRGGHLHARGGAVRVQRAYQRAIGRKQQQQQYSHHCAHGIRLRPSSSDAVINPMPPPPPPLSISAALP